MSDQETIDMFDDLDSTRMKLQLASRRRAADWREAAADGGPEVSRPLSIPGAFDEDEGIPSGGFQ